MPEKLSQCRPVADNVAYVDVVPTQNFKVRGVDATSASEIRKMYLKGNDQDRNQIITDLYCAKCETQCTNKEKWDKHILTAKHLKEKEEELTEEQLYCSKCRTQTHNKGEWEKHCKTNKHNAEIFTEKTCEVCNVVILNKPGWVQHCKTKKHVNNNGQTVSAAVQHTTA